MKRSLPKPWQRATRARPCPVCHAAGCLYAGPHGSPLAVVCANVESADPIGTAGYLHVLRDAGPTWAPWRVSLGRLAVRLTERRART
jgi:hypothetical protein